MAQSKLNDLAGKFGKGGPPGIGIGLKLLGVAGALAYGVTQSVYTGKFQQFCKWNFANQAAHVTRGIFFFHHNLNFHEYLKRISQSIHSIAR